MTGRRGHDELCALIRPVVTAAGLDLEQVSVRAAGRRQQLQVVVDSERGVDLDTVAEVSRALSEALDRSGVMGDGSYVLEVTSPGVDRPLRQPRHWRRATGRLVHTTVSGEPLTGRILAADDTGVVFDVDGQSRHVGYADLGDGAVQVEFNPPRPVTR